MPLLPQLARAEYAGVCLDLSRLADVSGVLRQRSERLREDLEVQQSVRRAVWAQHGAGMLGQMGSQSMGGGGSKQEDAAIASIESELDLLQRLRRTR